MFPKILVYLRGADMYEFPGELVSAVLPENWTT